MIYNLAATPNDVPEERWETLTESVGELFAAPAEVWLTESLNGVAELQVSETIPSSDKPDVRAVVESCVKYSLDSHEAIIPNQRVGWPEPRDEARSKPTHSTASAGRHNTSSPPPSQRRSSSLPRSAPADTPPQSPIGLPPRGWVPRTGRPP